MVTPTRNGGRRFRYSEKRRTRGAGQAGQRALQRSLDNVR